ncbi:hypothetical protein Pan97_25570 [Bremerella volcania]|uniref:Uncharacterized protein n=1 Tax=Bremerella volcania TaxID=2527984 RepID=A0A518C8J0_9BACT|nr:hypothetical protein [Bremerella volcania]QDU75524.1 hypothetical protein Pan97_25570 [Bremerella volcania]
MVQLRVCLCIFSGLVFLSALVVSLGIFAGMFSSGVADALTFDDHVEKAIEMRMSLSSSLYQTTIVVVASIWGIAILKKKETVGLLESPIEMLMFWFANVTLLVGIISHFVFSFEMSQIILYSGKWQNSVPDIAQWDVMNAFIAQVVGVFGGLVLVGLTFTSGRWLRAPSATPDDHSTDENGPDETPQEPMTEVSAEEPADAEVSDDEVHQ